MTATHEFIVYKRDSERLRRSIVADVLGEEDGELVVSLRPVAGTARIPLAWISHREVVPATEANRTERRETGM